MTKKVEKLPRPLLQNLFDDFKQIFLNWVTLNRKQYSILS